MLKKTITYTDYNGEERTEDFWFNLTKAEVLEMELGITGGLTAMINRVMAAQDVPTIMNIFKDIITKAYGEKSPDGRRFIKKDKDGRLLVEGFMETEAFSNLFTELAFDAEKAAAFVNGIVPQMDDKDKGSVAPPAVLKP